LKKIGILGGTFNPIHNGHLILAQNALEQCSLDEILFIPSGCSYMKQHVLDVKHRYRMTELAIAGHEAFQISAIEAERPGYSYTCETLQALHAQNPDVICAVFFLRTIRNWTRGRAEGRIYTEI